MFSWTRPDKPKDFDATVADGRTKVVCVLRAGRALTSEDFEPCWDKVSKKYKRQFQQRQLDRCAWCDSQNSGYGALDHVRPKSELALLDPSSPGKELANTGNRDPKTTRRALRKSAQGYWWLAFRWSNLVFACDRCNSGWKSSFFERAGDRTSLIMRDPCPSTLRSEGALLLDPYALPRLSTVLCFGVDGSVQGLSPEAKATVDIVALDRSSLRRQRKDVLVDLARSADRFERELEVWLKTDAREALRNAVEHLGDALRAGREDRAFAGVARCFLEARLGVEWNELEALLVELSNALLAVTAVGHPG